MQKQLFQPDSFTRCDQHITANINGKENAGLVLSNFQIFCSLVRVQTGGTNQPVKISPLRLISLLKMATTISQRNKNSTALLTTKHKSRYLALEIHTVGLGFLFCSNKVTVTLSLQELVTNSMRATYITQIRSSFLQCLGRTSR